MHRYRSVDRIKTVISVNKGDGWHCIGSLRSGRLPLFLVTFLYAIAFVGNLRCRRRSTAASPGRWSRRLIVNMLLLGLFAIQHSVMARPAVQALVDAVRAAAGRAQHLCAARQPGAGAAVLAVAADAGVVWQSTNPPAPCGDGLSSGSAGPSCCQHLPDQSLRTVRPAPGLCPAPRPATAGAGFRTPFFYKCVRHPIYLGFMLAFWATPTMTAGHLLFAVATTGYILIGISRGARPDPLVRRSIPPLREPVSMLIPLPGASPEAELARRAALRQPKASHRSVRTTFGAGDRRWPRIGKKDGNQRHAARGGQEGAAPERLFRAVDARCGGGSRRAAQPDPLSFRLQAGDGAGAVRVSQRSAARPPEGDVRRSGAQTFRAVGPGVRLSR